MQRVWGGADNWMWCLNMSSERELWGKSHIKLPPLVRYEEIFHCVPAKAVQLHFKYVYIISCVRWVGDLQKQTDGTSKADMFFIDLQSDFLKPLMEPLMQQVSLMGFWRGKLADSAVNISIGDGLIVCLCVDVYMCGCLSTCWYFPSHFHNVVSVRVMKVIGK